MEAVKQLEYESRSPSDEQWNEEFDVVEAIVKYRIEKRRQAGRLEGILEGILEGKTIVVQRMSDYKLDLDLIVKVTGFPLEQVEQIIANHEQQKNEVDLQSDSAVEE